MSIKKIALGSVAAVMALSTAAHASVIDRPFFKVLGTVVVWSATSSTSGAVVHDFIINTSAGDGDADLIAADGQAVVTGTLVPFAANANGAFDANDDGTLDASLAVTDSIDAQIGSYQSSFHVASNTLFNIKAVADDFAATGDFVEADVIDDNGTPLDPLDDVNLGPNYADNITLELTAVDNGTSGTVDFGGPKAQLPYTDAAAAFGDFTVGGTATLEDLLTEDDVFEGTRRTAQAAGSIAEQSVRFDAVYNLQDDAGNGYDMSMGFGELSARVTYTVYVP